jgi:hypothetical protein
VLLSLSDEMAEKGHVLSAREPVNEPLEPAGVLLRIERRHESGRLGSHPGEQVEDAGADRGHASIGEAGGDQPDDLAVTRIIEPSNDTDGVAVEEPPIVMAAKVLEDDAKRGRHVGGTRHAGKDTNLGRLSEPAR